MNYTEKYHLPQWEETDRIMRTDFNRMCADIETGLNTNAQAAAKAHSAADRAQATAEQLPYVVGSYVGTGAEMTIELGFRPSYLIVSGMIGTTDYRSVWEYEPYYALTAGANMPERLIFIDTGFTAYPYHYEGKYYPDLTQKNRLYEYIAFK